MTKAVGVTMVRNEADIIRAALVHMLSQVDAIVVIDNDSTDATADLIGEVMKWEGHGRTSVLHAAGRAYLQSKWMTHGAEVAVRDHGADWIVPFDADEFWLAPGWRDGQTVAERLREVGGQGASLFPIPVIAVPIYNHYCTALDPARTGTSFIPDYMPWRSRTPLPLHKVAFRWTPGAVIEMGNHAVSFPVEGGMAAIPGFDAGITIRHYPYRSAEHMTAKAIQGAEAYVAAGDEVPADAGAHWRAWGQLIETRGPEVIGDIFREHYWHLSPVDAGLVRDPWN